MAFTTDQQQEIIRTLTGKAPNLRACSLCGTQAGYTLADKLVSLSLQDQPGTFVIGGPTMPTVALVCKNCGNTYLVNLMVLGLPHLAAPPAAKEGG